MNILFLQFSPLPCLILSSSEDSSQQPQCVIFTSCQSPSSTTIQRQATLKLCVLSISVTGRGGPQGCETSRLPHFLENRLTDGSEVVILTRRPAVTPQADSWYSFLLEAELTPGP
jgi:hypothetical protein